MSELEQVSKLIGDIYDAALDSGLWHEVVTKIANFVPGAFAPPVALDDRRLEGLLPQLRHFQPHLASPGLQVALVVPGAGIPPRLATLIALRIAQPVGLGVQQRVQSLLHAAAHHPVEVALIPTRRLSDSRGFPNQRRNDSRWQTEGRLPWGKPLWCGRTI
jgi:hypothetical protein